MLFEEPELFLHPHGRRHLYRLLCELSNDGTQVLYTTHSQDFVDLTRIDCVQLVTKTVESGTVLRPPRKKPLSEDGRKRLKVIKHFSSPRNEVFFANSVVLVEGVTEQAVISYLAEVMPTVLELDRLNCSVIEVGGKDNLPLFIRMMLALEKRLLVIYDTDSDKTNAQDVATNEKRKKEIQEALGDRGAIFECDPCIESVAEMADPRRKDKDERMREHLTRYRTWNDVSDELKKLMQAVAALAVGKDGTGK